MDRRTSKITVAEMASRTWPKGTEMRVLSVNHDVFSLSKTSWAKCPCLAHPAQRRCRVKSLTLLASYPCRNSQPSSLTQP